MAKKISAENVFRIEQMLKQGLTGDQVADKAGVSISTVTKVRKTMEEKGFDIWHKPGVVSKKIKIN